jgi:hypothetical protein
LFAPSAEKIVVGHLSTNYVKNKLSNKYLNVKKFMFLKEKDMQ